MGTTPWYRRRLSRKAKTCIHLTLITLCAIGLWAEWHAAADWSFVALAVACEFT